MYDRTVISTVTYELQSQDSGGNATLSAGTASHFTLANSAGAFSISAAAKSQVDYLTPKVSRRLNRLIEKVNKSVHFRRYTAMFTNYEPLAAMLLC